MKFELYKIFCRKATIVFFFVVLIVVLATVILNLAPQQQVWSGFTHHINDWQERTLYLIETTGSISAPEGGTMFPLGGRFLPFWEDVESPFIQRLVGMYRQIEVPLDVVPNVGWDHILRFLTASMFFVGIVIILGVAPVFAEERSTGVDKIILTAKYGKGKVNASKILSALIFTSTVYVLFVAAIVVPSILYYGTYGWNHPVQLYFT